MILSDRDIREAIAGGRIKIEPFSDDDVQPSSIDLHVDRFFRTFHNARHPFIDVKKPMEDLTELVEVNEDEAFILHPGEFVLGSTREYVSLPTDLVARLEGKSSLGRLGLLIHSSLPGDEPILYLHDGQLRQITIETIVRKQLEGQVVSFDPETFEIAYHDVTGWHETEPDRIFEVRLASGRRIRLTGGHALFTLNSSGDLTKVRVLELTAGSKVAVPGFIPDPRDVEPTIDLLRLAPESSYSSLVVGGPTVADAFADTWSEIAALFKDIGNNHIHFYRSRQQLPMSVALQIDGLVRRLGPDDRLAIRGSRHRLPVQIAVDSELAWLLGLYVAEGSRREKQAVLSNTDQAILDRAQAVLARLGMPVYRSAGAITCCSQLFASLMEWLEMGRYAASKRIPAMLLGWPEPLLKAFLEGFVDGDGSRQSFRTSMWTSSSELVGDLLLLCSRLHLRAGSCYRERRNVLWQPQWQVYIPLNEHKLLTSVPQCSDLLAQVRRETGLSQVAAARLAGFKHNTQLCNIEKNRAPVQFRTLRALRHAYSRAQPPSLYKLERLLEGGILWDRVVEVIDTGEVEPVFDLEVLPNGRRIENFVAGRGGVFTSNTAGYVDPGFEGHLTLELSNVANLPITLYPNMKIGQISFFRLTSEAEHPYGSSKVGSKYQGQRGPTPSRYHENFEL